MENQMKTIPENVKHENPSLYAALANESRHLTQQQIDEIRADAVADHDDRNGLWVIGWTFLAGLIVGMAMVAGMVNWEAVGR
jgi:hypothetical protein